MASPAGSAPRQGPRWWYMSPLALTLLPLLYSAPALKSRPQLRTGLFFGAVGLGLVHGTTLILNSGARADPGGEALVPVRAAPRGWPVAPSASGSGGGGGGGGTAAPR